MKTHANLTYSDGQGGQVVRELAPYSLGPGFKPSLGTIGICPQTLPLINALTGQLVVSYVC